MKQQLIELLKSGKLTEVIETLMHLIFVGIGWLILIGFTLGMTYWLATDPGYQKAFYDLTKCDCGCNDQGTPYPMFTGCF